MVKITPNSNMVIQPGNYGDKTKAPGGAGPSTADDNTSPTPGPDVQVTPVGAPFKPINTTNPAGATGGPPGEAAVKSAPRSGLDALRG